MTDHPRAAAFTLAVLALAAAPLAAQQTSATPRATASAAAPVPPAAAPAPMATASGANPQLDDITVGRAMATRADLQEIADRLEANGGDPALLGQARARLTEGDFHPGDRIDIVTQGDSGLSKTFNVWPDLSLHLPSPTVGNLSLRGTLRSELQDKVSAYVARFVRNPDVRARPLIRIAIQGEVQHPGYYTVPVDGDLSDALMAAGGTTPAANFSKAQVERNGHRVLDKGAVQIAMANGQSLDESGVRDGDQLDIPKKATGLFTDNLRLLGILVTTTIGIITLSNHHW
ncbi:MAG TPA: SLBB domain-containing protein [Gemmatimonadales bacterium]|jgi:protein involved in polysaccharide export with SLBB domain